MADVKLWILTWYTLAFSSLYVYAVEEHVAKSSLQNIEDVLRRLDALGKREQEQDVVIQKLQEKARTQEKTIQSQHRDIETLKIVLQNIGVKDDPVTQTETKEFSPEKRLVLVPTEGPVAFHARIDKGSIEHIGITQKLVFDITVLNIGGGYHNSSGIFTAPVPGIYLFSLSVCILHPGNDIHAEIMKNGVQVGGSYANGYDQGSITVLIPLAMGDEVWVSSLHHPDTYLWGDTLTSFMGYMVSEL